MKKKRYILITCVAAGVLLIAGLLCFFAAASRPKLPRLYFEGNISNMVEKSDQREISFEYDDGQEVITGYAQLKVQGTSSLAYSKKNYTIKFYQDPEYKDTLKIDVGWGAESKYCLKANWIDKTHARNIVTAKIASQVQQKYNVLTQAPCNGLIDGFPIEIYSNGKFLGLYTFNIPKDAWQFGMDDDNPDHIVICGEDWEPANLFLGEPDFDTWSVEVGEESDETLEKMKTLFDFVLNSTDEVFKADFEKHLDLDSALNYYILADAVYLQDNLGKNMLLATYDGEKWYLSLYDMDASWGTDCSGTALWDYDTELLGMSKNNLFARMEKCFAEELADRYFELRQDILTKEHIMSEFEAFSEPIPKLTFWKEVMKWGVGFVKTPSDIPGFDYSQIEDYLDIMLDALDAKYAAMAGE